MTLSHPAAEPKTTSCHGYASPQYAQSLSEFGMVRKLPACRGWLLERPIPNSTLVDGMGGYPLFCCQDWGALADDLDSLAHALVCVSLVTDPFANLSTSQLQAAFQDVCYEYKQHFVTDLSVPLENVVRGHHLRHVRAAKSVVEVRKSTDDCELLSHWLSLYGNLVKRHGIAGIARFSPLAFERQMQVPGLTAFSAFDNNTICGMTLWYMHGDVAYYHLGAYSERGYELGASYALFWHALEQFARAGIPWAALGAGAGTTSAESGLTRFKKGWATGTRPVYFCGRILQPAAYRSLLANASEKTDYFPAYRRP